MGVITLILVISIIGFTCTGVRTYNNYKKGRENISCIAALIIWAAAVIICTTAYILP